MKKITMRQLLQNADENAVRRIAGISPVFTEKQKETVYRNILEKVQPEHSETEFTDEVSGTVTTVRFSMFRHFAAAAACLLVIGGTAGGLLTMQSRNSLSDQTASEVTEMQENADASPEENSGENPAELTEEPVLVTSSLDYDMSSQMGIYGKMLNSIDFYDNVSGTILTSDTADPECCIQTAFCCNLPDSMSYEKIEWMHLPENWRDILLTEPLALTDAGQVLETYCDGTSEYNLYSLMREYRLSADESGTAQHRDDMPVSPEFVQQWILEHIAEDDWNTFWNNMETAENLYRNDATNTRAAFRSILPNRFAMDYLTDFDSWEISGETVYAGCEAVVISGTAGAKNHAWWDLRWVGGDFTACIDKATGCLLCFVEYDAEGNPADWMLTTDIRFDEEALWTAPDLSEYTYMPNIPVDMEEYYAYKTNSKGETYGVCGQYAISWENYDLLPDLIAYDYEPGNKEKLYYQRKDEIFAIFPGDPERDTYRQEHNKLDTDTPVSINEYDCEGNYVCTIVYYH